MVKVHNVFFMNNCNEFFSEKNANIVIGQSTLPTQEMASLLVDTLLESGLIACGQIEGPITSKYTWNGKINETQEWRVTLKFNKENISQLTKVILQNHPYENPEWVYWGVHATKQYSDWVQDPIM
jgi:periplasmic divalent cation tolerance protein